MPFNKQYFEILPINDQSTSAPADNQVNGGFSFNGQPTIKFSIPASERLLESKALVLSGQIIYTQSDSNAVFSDLTNIDNNNGANLAKVTGTNHSVWGGVHNIIDKLVISSKKSNTELNHTNNYGLYASLRQGLRNNEKDYLEVPLNRSLASGSNADFVNRRMNLVAQVADAGLSSNGGSNNKVVGQQFSIKLDDSLLQSQNIHLGNNFANGLMITIHLKSDASYFHQRFRSVDVAQQTGSDISKSKYILKNLRLEGRYINPMPQELKQYSANMPLNSRLNLINDISADEASNYYSPNLRAVSAIANVGLDEDQQNNLSFQETNYRHLVGSRAYTQSKDNLRYPADYETKFVPNFKSAVDNGVSGLNPSVLANPICSLGDAEVRKQFEKSMLNGKEPMHSSSTLLLTNASLQEDYDPTASGTDGVGNNNKADLVGIGADYTLSVGAVQMYSGNDYALATKSGIKTNDNNLPASRNNKAVLLQSFVKHMEVLNLNSLQKSS